jgi:hypothetical protein
MVLCSVELYQASAAGAARPLKARHGCSVTLCLEIGRMECGTCTHRRRICRPEHVMLTNSISRQRVCLRPQRTLRESRTTGSPCRPAGLGSACPAPSFYTRNPHAEIRSLRCVHWPRLGRQKHDVCLPLPALTSGRARSSSTSPLPFGPGLRSSASASVALRSRSVSSSAEAHHAHGAPHGITYQASAAGRARPLQARVRHRSDDLSSILRP